VSRLLNYYKNYDKYYHNTCVLSSPFRQILYVLSVYPYYYYIGLQSLPDIVIYLFVKLVVRCVIETIKTAYKGYVRLWL